MTRNRSSVAATLTRAWTKLYTAGMDPVLRDRRRVEIDSDLWESDEEDAVKRLIRGIPADLLWRMEHATMNEKSFHHWLQSLTVLGLLAGVVWSAFVWARSAEIQLPPLPPRGMHFVEKRPPPPPPPPPPTWDEFVARVRGTASGNTAKK